jgi:hypothetical protein
VISCNTSWGSSRRFFKAKSRTFTSRKRALQFAKTGRAVFVAGNLPRFIEADPRNQAAVQGAASGYNSVERLLSKAEIENIPLARPAKALKEALIERFRSLEKALRVASQELIIAHGLVLTRQMSCVDYRIGQSPAQHG